MTERPNYERLRTLFNQALECEGEERQKFVDRECGDEPELKAKLLSMLGSASRSEEFLDPSDSAIGGQLFDGLMESVAEGQAVGPYTVIRELGRGGMGVVYLARRTDGQFEQQVALKLVKRGMDSEAILRSFLRERQILASLRHDSIAQLFDGGVTDDGRPYFAMEYVEGVSITSYCDSKQLDVSQRLRLFQRVAAVVQYAHGSLIVHRDIKPSNILVDAEGNVKLLDFGIAKLLGEETDGIDHTITRMRAMTPERAAPEQLRGEPVTTATDVYALGVLLYELLTGHLPYKFEHRDADAIARVISQSKPAQPSTIVGQTHEVRHSDGTKDAVSPATVSSARRTRLDQLKRQLSGDLDTIVLKSIQEEAARRYASAEAFLEDIDRFLHGLPVRARPDTATYRLSKFVQRNAMAVAAAATITLLLVAFAISSRIQQAQTARERDTAEQVKEFVLSFFEASNPEVEARGDSVTARDLLDRGVRRIDTELADQPEIQAELLAVAAQSFQALGSFQRAEPLFRRALALREDRLAGDRRGIARSLGELGSVLSAMEQQEEAEQLNRRALDAWRDIYRGDHPEIADAIRSVGLSAFQRADYAEADSLCRVALAMKERLYAPGDLALARGQRSLAKVLIEKGEYEEAKSLYELVLQAHLAAHGEDHTRTAGTRSDYGLLLVRMGEYEEAEENLRASLAARRRLLGDDSYQLVAPLNNLSDLLQKKNEYEEAELLQREALVLRRAELGDDSPAVALGLNNLAGVLMRQFKFDEAEAMYRESLDINRRLLGDHPRVGLGLHNLAIFFQDQAKYDSALDYHRQAIDLLAETLGAEHPNVSFARNSMAMTFYLKGEYSAAEANYRQALEGLSAKLPAGHPTLAECSLGLGETLLALKRPADAEPFLIRARDDFAAKFTEDHSATAAATVGLGACRSAMGQWEEGEELLLQGYQTISSRDAVKRVEQGALRYLVAHYERRGMPDEAAKYAEQLE